MSIEGVLTIRDTGELVALALSLGARAVTGWSRLEEQLIQKPLKIDHYKTQAIYEQIQKGADPLGDLFCTLQSPEIRRPLGAIYTPPQIATAMLRWALQQKPIHRVIDPGTGSGRFLAIAGRLMPDATLYGVEINPIASILARGHIAALGMANRTTIILDDYRQTRIPEINGTTLYVGNPPYVRHHLIGISWKKWLRETAHKYDLQASQLAGLHAYFFLATAEMAKAGDIGVYITAAEWLDVNYGSIIRQLLLNTLGLKNLHVIEPAATPFPGTATTAVITGFEIGSKSKSVAIKRVSDLDNLQALQTTENIHRERFENSPRWTPLTRAITEKRTDFVQLGELCRVHRGQVTGANKVWIAGLHSTDLPKSVLFPTVTRAKEIIRAGQILDNIQSLREVIDLPLELDCFDIDTRHKIDKFLKFAASQGADKGYIAQHRKAWWSVGLRQPAPILATYMARRPPVFVRNVADARHINIAHGLYPRDLLPEQSLRTLANFLSHSVSMAQGRTYAGGLTKFEPREMERILVPRPEILALGMSYEEVLQ